MKKKINLRELKLLRLRFKRLTYRTGLILFGIIATAILAFNFWFIDHAEEALEQIVYTQSKGKLKLKVGKFRFNWIKNNITLEDASIFTNDSTIATSYAVNTKHIRIKARGFLPLLFNREILIDSIRLQSPGVVFTRNIARIKNKAGRDTANNEFSVAEEMGRISRSITDAINVLHIDKFRLENGSFSLIDNTKKNEAPFVVNNIYIQLDNLQFDSIQSGKKGKEKISFTDNFAIRTFNQNLVFPGGRHFLAFKDFRVNLANQRVEFDSCTIRAIKGDSSKTSFRIFFDKLQLTNINFDSLYSAETIMADSVFCNHPQIFLDIDGDQKTAKSQDNNGEKKVGGERVDAVIQQLLGDMVLNYVGVKNADINVSTIKRAMASTFSSRNTNFEIYGLAVRQDEERPVHLDKFIMTLHNFENVLSDGRYRIAFDSIGFEDDVINLNKFSFKEYDKARAVKILAMPSFLVRGLSWESLLYDNIFSAQSAEFFSPIVDYTINRKKRKRRSRNLFETLNNIDGVMDLKNLRIHEGDIMFRFGKSATLSLLNTNLDLRANDLTSADKIKSVQRSVNLLSFDKGIFKRDDFVVHLNQAVLSENKSGLKAENMLLQSNNIKADARNIHLGDIVLDSTRHSVTINGITWSKANITLDNVTGSKQHKAGNTHKRTASLILRNIKGDHTYLDLAIQQNKLTGHLNTFIINEFEKKAGSKPEIKGISFDGRNMLFSGPDTRVSVAEVDITDKNNSVLKDIRFEKINRVDSIIAAIPRLMIIPNITEVIAGNLTLQDVVLTEPVVTAKMGKKEKAAESTKREETTINIGSALFERPRIKLALMNKDNAASYINWGGAKQSSYLKVTNFETAPDIPLKAEQVKMYLTNFEFIDAKGKKTATNDNRLDLEFNDVLMKKNDRDQLDWQTSLNILSLDKIFFDSLGKNNSVLELDKGDIKNIALHSKYINKPAAIIANSERLQINGTNGSFSTGKSVLQWHGFSFNKGILGIDSFSLVPKQSVEAYRIAKAFNEDYLKVRTGKISAGPINMKKFDNDSILDIDHIRVNDVDLFTFKDKTQPDTLVKYKPLPAEMLRKVNSSINIDSLSIPNMHVTYWEINPDTDTLGIVPVENLNVLMTHIKNYDINAEDSIYILASADVLGSLHTTLNVAQSYADSTGYMRMNLTTGPMDLTKFNTVLVPLVGAKVFKGRLRSLSIKAIGNNNAAVGSAYMDYSGLKVGVLNKKDLPNQTFINKLTSKIAMAFVVRKNNRGRESLVFFERWQEKSPINYIIKTSLEGIKSGIGLPGAKKKLRRYNKKTLHQEHQ